MRADRALEARREALSPAEQREIDLVCALHWAARRGDCACLTAILEHADDVTFHLALPASSTFAIPKASRRLGGAAQLLRAKGGRGETALICAAAAGHAAVCAELMRRDPSAAHVGLQRLGGYTALAGAAYRGHRAALQAILDGLAPENRVALLRRRGIRERRGNLGFITPLMLAAAHGHAGCVEALVEADPHERHLLLRTDSSRSLGESAPMTARDLAGRYGHPAIASWLGGAMEAAGEAERRRRSCAICHDAFPSRKAFFRHLQACRSTPCSAAGGDE